MRTYEMFVGDFEKAAPWNPQGVKGCKRFIDRVWSLQEIVNDKDGYSPELETLMHKTIKKVTEDIDSLGFNTAIAAMMTLVNEMVKLGSVSRDDLKTLTLLFNPFAPHMTEELWEVMNFGGTVTDQKWPAFDESKCVENEVEIAVQVNGKIKARIHVPADIEQADALAKAKSDEKVAAEIAGKTIVKELYVKGRLVNIVVK